MQADFEKLIRDTAAVGVSAALLALEIGTKLLRSNLVIGLRLEHEAPHGPTALPHKPSGTVHPSYSHESDEQIERRAYERWKRAGRPDG